MAADHNPIVIRKGLRLGELAAEADQDLLSHCFIDNGVFEKIANVSDPTAIVIGRTGAGKSALIFHAARVLQHAVIISPEDVSIRFLEHSNIVEFLSELGIKLDLFYRALWRHIIVSELIKLRYNIKNSKDGKSFIDRFSSIFYLDSSKRKAKAYLEEWGDKFWLETDEQLREITKRLNTDVHIGLGAEYKGLQLSGKAARSLSQEDRTEVVARASRVVSAIQIKKLEEIIELLQENSFDDSQKTYFLLVDNLDEEWAETITRCQFIRALIEEIRYFRRLSQVKIVTVIRDDLLELVYDRTKDAGFQEEKYESYMISLRWSEADLRSLLETRVAEVFKRQYTNAEVGIRDIFPSPKKGDGDPVEFMLHRTLRRPRDLLQFANESFALAHDRERVSWRSLRAAEATYSRKRLKSLFEEWGSIFPSLPRTIELLRGLQPEITRSSVSNEAIDELALVLAQEAALKDPCVSVAKAFVNGAGASRADLVDTVLQCFYRCGIIGIKISVLDTFIWGFIDHPVLAASEARRANQIRIHLMLRHALDIHEPVLRS